MIELFSPPFRSIVANREAVIDPGPMPPLGLVGQAEAAPEAPYIGHAERKCTYEWQTIRVEEIALGRSRACLFRGCCVCSRKSVRVQCLRCGHFNVLTPEMLSLLAVSPTTPIAAFVKRLRCRECGSQSVLATRKPPQPPITKR
jgi:hypothetical protein